VRHLTLEEWEKKWIARPIERFDQKNEMFKRPLWDPEVKELKRKVFGVAMPKDKAGYHLEEMVLGNASWYLELGFAEGVIIGQTGLFAWDSKQLGVSKPPDGLKVDFADPAEATRDIKKVATYFGADMVGVCELDQRWIYSHLFHMYTRESKPLEIPEEYKYAIAMAHEMDYDLEKYAPAQIANAATGMGYTKMAFTAGLLAQFIRGLGYKAIPCGNDTALSVPVAMQAGLGELARNGLLITPEYGPRVRISKVFTDLPLVPDKPIEFGVTEFCLKCSKCTDACPGQAIIYGDRITEPHNISNATGELKWPIDAEKCLAFWGANEATCTVCIRVCPFNKHMNWFHRTSRWFVDHARWGDPFYRKMDDLLGYGKQKKADNFWAEWQPRQALRITQK